MKNVIYFDKYKKNEELSWRVMMNFFPVPYEDELFYSMISRYKQACGMISKKAFLRDIYNKEVYPKSIFFPKSINRIVSNMPVTSSIDAEYFIYEHTMFPLFTAFLSNEKSQARHIGRARYSAKLVHKNKGWTIEYVQARN